MSTRDELTEIPGVGPRIAAALRELGVGSIAALARRSPERMFEQLCALRGEKVDRCVLYTFRCAVYYAANEQHDPELLKWWNWKGRDASSAAA